MIEQEALALALQIKDLEARLEPLKEALRKKALLQEPIAKGRVSFKTSEGDVTVTFQKDKIVLSDETRTLTSTLGEEVFSLLFRKEEKFFPREDLPSLIGNLPPEQQVLVDACVSYKTETPRVGFHPKKG